MNLSELEENIKRDVVGSIDMSKEVSDERIYESIDECIVEYARHNYINLDMRKKVRRDVFDSLRRLDVLQELIDDDNITEIMVNGSEKIFIEESGRIRRYEKKFESAEKLSEIAMTIASNANRIVNESSPIVDARLKDGSRVNIVLRPVAINGPIITIRKFPKHPFTMDKLIEIGSLDVEVAEFLKILVKSGYNIFVSGGTGSGKTTFLNALSNYIPEDERIITIEDSAELQIERIDNLVRLETRNASVDGTNEVSIRDLIKSALRMRPDRIIVGEVRGIECIDMLQAMNTGHDGSLSTGHANSSSDMLSRLETMVLMGMDIPLSAVKAQIASAIDIIIHLGRIRDKTRKVLEISEIDGIENGEIILNKIYEYREKGEDDRGVIGNLAKVGGLKNEYKLRAAGCKT